MSEKAILLKNYFVKFLLSPFLNGRSEVEKEKVKKILIFGHMGLGNLLMFIPTIKAFKQHFTNATIALVSDREYALELVRHIDLIDDFLILREGCSAIEKFKFLIKIRKEKFDMIVKTFNGPFYTIIGLSGIPYRVGHASNPGWSIPKDYVLNYKAIMGENQHEIERDLSLFYAIGGENQEVEKKFTLMVPEDVRQWAIRFMGENTTTKEDRTVGMQVGTTSIWKQWDLDKMAKVADLLIEQYKAKVIFLGGRGEIEQAQYIEHKMENAIINAVGKTTLLQASSLLERCALFICNDTGLLHLSVAVNTIVIAIFGPTDYTRTGPWKDGCTIVRKKLSCSPCYKTRYRDSKIETCPHHNCLKLITVNDVMKAVQQYIGI